MTKLNPKLLEQEWLNLLKRFDSNIELQQIEDMRFLYFAGAMTVLSILFDKPKTKEELRELVIDLRNEFMKFEIHFDRKTKLQ